MCDKHECNGSCHNCQHVTGFEKDNIRLEIYRNRSEMEATITLKDTGEMVARIPVEWKRRNGKLDYLSVSKIQSYEQ